MQPNKGEQPVPNLSGADTGVGQSLQCSDELGRILFSLASVGSRLCSIFHRKLVPSEPMPLNLAFLQLISQSAVGEVSSALDLMYSIEPF